jgi:hypothetical protein
VADAAVRFHRYFTLAQPLHFGEHLAREEDVILPAVRRLLDGATDAVIVKEIRLRRRQL